jgi:hypothetical protein
MENEAKEKALELVNKYYDSLPQWVNGNDAKQCALIEVDEILSLHKKVALETLKFYLEVKQEIEKL